MFTKGVENIFKENKKKMAKSETIKAAIDANINTNGNQAITGAVMNAVLKQMVDSTDAQLTELSDKAIQGNGLVNLFNKDTAIDGYYVTPDGLEALDGWSASDYIPIKPNTTYSATLISNSRYYDANKNYLSNIISDTFTTPSNAAYIRLSLYTDMKDSFMLNEGAELKEYVPYGNFLPISAIDSKVVEYLNQELGIDEIKSEIPKDYIKGEVGANLFNKDTAIDGYYVTPDGLEALDGWSASDYIPIKPNTTYSATLISNSRYYDANKNYLSNIISDTFTTPSNAAYIRLSLYTDMKDSFMLNEGAELKEYEPYGIFLPVNAISSKVVDYIKSQIEQSEDKIIPYFNRLREHLDNPFIRTQIKLIGDSITAGMGGTGFSPSGEVIGGGDLGNANILSATCWANMFYHYINDRYNKDVNVTVDNPNIVKPTIGVSAIVNADEGKINGNSYATKFFTLVENNNDIGSEFCEFNFYGDHFSICVQKSPLYGGVFEVIVDGNLVSTIDCYASEESYLNNVGISLLSEKQHDVILRCTGTKNPSSQYNQIRINGLVIPKTAIVKNWGVSGTTSELIKNKSGYISSEDDFVIAQFGTNDRHIMFSPFITEDNLIEGCNNIINEYNALPILMCAPPTSEYHNSEFAEGGYYFTMNEVHDAIASVADKFDMPYIDNYTAMQEYADEHDITTDDLLSDGLHPNDLGYKVIFINIMKSLGLARIPFYDEWLGANS